MPSGLGIILINERAIETVKEKQIQYHYNDLLNLVLNAEKWQTTHTPNILNIHALAFSQSKTSSIESINKELIFRKNEIVTRLPQYTFVASNTQVQSTTIFTIETKKSEQIISEALKNNIVLGKGYGQWEKATFRIANFPSIEIQSFEKLITFLNSIKKATLDIK